MVDLLPFGKVVVRTNKLDREAGLLVIEASDEKVESGLEATVDEGGVVVPIVFASPSTVVIIITPEESVYVYTEPGVRDGDSVDETTEGALDVAWGASVLVNVMETTGVAELGAAEDSVLEPEAPPSLVRSIGAGVVDGSFGGVALVSVPFKFS